MAATTTRGGSVLWREVLTFDVKLLRFAGHPVWITSTKAKIPSVFVQRLHADVSIWALFGSIQTSTISPTRMVETSDIIYTHTHFHWHPTGWRGIAWNCVLAMDVCSAGGWCKQYRWNEWSDGTNGRPYPCQFHSLLEIQWLWDQCEFHWSEIGSAELAGDQ